MTDNIKSCPPESITVQSSIHGKRTWRRIGERDHVTRDGRRVVLAVWETPCVVCGEAFTIATLTRVTSAEKNPSFLMITCPNHRMTRREVGQMNWAKANRKTAVFEAIKKAKLSADKRSAAKNQPQKGSAT